MSADSIRVLIVDDHAVVREGLRAFLQIQDGIEVVGEAADGAGSVELAAELAPDVVLMDLVMPGPLNGVGAMRALRERVPHSRVIVLTSFLDDERLMPAVQAGADGYLLKDVEPSELVRAIRTVQAGEAMIAPTVAGRLLRTLAAPRGSGPGDGEQLTRRELEVLKLIVGGRSNKRIAFELGIAEKTVKTHVGHLLGKLGVTDRTQAALLAVQSGLAEAPAPPGTPRPRS
jgi:DNA-binding NarL/FixJ family response regulator